MCFTLSRVTREESEGSVDSSSSSPKGGHKGKRTFQSENSITILSSQCAINPLFWYSGAAQKSLARKFPINNNLLFLD